MPAFCAPMITKFGSAITDLARSSRRDPERVVADPLGWPVATRTGRPDGVPPRPPGNACLPKAIASRSRFGSSRRATTRKATAPTATSAATRTNGRASPSKSFTPRTATAISAVATTIRTSRPRYGRTATPAYFRVQYRLSGISAYAATTNAAATA